MSIVFISDTHLGEDSEDCIESQKNIITCLSQYNDLEELYLLGDIFNVWIGDKQLYQQNLKPLFEFLRNLSKTCKIYFMHGNRDFLVSKKICKELNINFLTDPHIININNQSILLTHGDLLCTDDKGYQNLRKILRNKLLQKIFLLIPYQFKTKIANKLRKISIKKQKRTYSSDINLAELDRWYKKYNFDVIIHGHTHISNKYQYNGYKRLVLSDWHASGGIYCLYQNNQLKLESFLI